MAKVYRIEYSPDAESHIRALPARDRSMIVDAVDRQLTNQPTSQTRNRKPMRSNPFGAWELRIGDYRVYYVVREDPGWLVLVRAIGVKDHNTVRVGGEVVDL